METEQINDLMSLIEAEAKIALEKDLYDFFNSIHVGDTYDFRNISVKLQEIKSSLEVTRRIPDSGPSYYRIIGEFALNLFNAMLPKYIQSHSEKFYRVAKEKEYYEKSYIKYVQVQINKAEVPLSFDEFKERDY